jgi:hypothetical protein
MKLWLDDIRDPSKLGLVGWVWCRTAESAIDLFKSGDVTKASLDHDLSWEHYPGSGIPERQWSHLTGYDVVCWLEEHPEYWPHEGVTVHSMNQVGRKRMLAVVRKHYGKREGDERLV